MPNKPEIEKSCNNCINELLKKTEVPCLYCNLASKEYRGGDGIYWTSDLSKDHKKEQPLDVSYDDKEMLYGYARDMLIDCANNNYALTKDLAGQYCDRILIEGKRQQKETTEKIIRDMIKETGQPNFAGRANGKISYAILQELLTRLNKEETK